MKEEIVQTTIKVKKPILAEVRNLAYDKGISQTELIVRYITKGLVEEGVEIEAE